MMKFNAKLLALSMLYAVLTYGQGQKDYQPTPQNVEARQWFTEAKFGLFVHWGVYSILGDGEWVMNNQNIPIDAYEKLPAFFNPIGFDADEWVKMAKDAGMKYITITSRHHDGFSLFDTKTSTYDIVDSTPYGRDILKQLVNACRKEGTVVHIKIWITRFNTVLVKISTYEVVIIYFSISKTNII